MSSAIGATGNFPNPPLTGRVESLGAGFTRRIEAVGSLTCLALATCSRAMMRRPRGRTLWPSLYQIGFESIPVVLVTGAFIGMVLAVQSYDQLRTMHLENRIGSVINLSLVEELGPVLAAIMLAGRVGSAMAAQLGTMKVTEQIDALVALGADPIQYLVVPRFLGCFLLIPALAILADALGMAGGWLLSTQVLGVPSYEYWFYTDQFVTAFDVLSGIFKSMFFGAAIGIISCHRGFHCGSGAEGVGKAATESFVWSFVAILFLDLVLGMTISQIQILLAVHYPELLVNASTVLAGGLA